MEFDYIDHAEENIKERNIDKKLIEDVVKKPDKLIDAGPSRKIAQRVIGNKLLRVIHEKQGNTYIIVTAYYTSLKRYL